MPAHIPQLTLRLDAANPLADRPWQAGSVVVHLGESLTLVLDTAARESLRSAGELHLPLPPAATPRQIRDAAESWLRDEALRCFAAIVAQQSALAGRQVPGIALTFGKRSDWARREGAVLRCHWRLIEQPPDIVEQVLARALMQAAATPVSDDLFALH